jgi:thiol-disulfide isomerase/thioredoxin
MNTNKVTKVIKLGATWCAPCRVYADKFHRVSKMEEFKDIEFNDYDIEQDEEGEAAALKYNIRSVPTTLLLDENGEVIYKLMGNVPESDLVKIINEALKDR